MKKKLLLVLSLLFVLVAAAAVTYKIKTAKLTIESILPQSPIFFLRTQDTAKSLDEFKQTRLMRNIKRIDLKMLMEKSNVPPAQIEEYKMFTSKLKDFISQLPLRKFLGEEVAFAYYIPSSAGIDFSRPAAVLANIIFVTRLYKDAEPAELINKLSLLSGEKIKPLYETYKSHKVGVVELNKEISIAYTKIKDLLVVGFAKERVKSCLDVFSSQSPSFAKDRDYLSFRRKLYRSPRTVGYVNIEKIISQTKKYAAKSSKNDEALLKEKERTLKALGKLSILKKAVFASLPGAIAKSEFIITLDENKFSSAAGKIYSFPPKRNNTLKFIPKNIISYQWQNYFDFKTVFNDFFESMDSTKTASQPSSAEIIKSLEEGLHLSWEKDIIPIFGNETGGYLYDIDLGGFFPMPKALLFVKVNKKDAADRLLHKLAGEAKILLKTEEYSGATINYFSLPFVLGLQPSYTFLDDYLLLASSSEVLKASIDTYNTKLPSILQNSGFKAVNFGLTDKNNSISFIKMDLFFGKMEEVINWAGGWLSLAFSQKEAYQKKIEDNLGELAENIYQTEKELENLRTSEKPLKEEIERLASIGGDTSSLQKELESLKVKIDAKEKERSLYSKAMEENRKELKQAKGQRKIDPGLVKIYLKEVILPIVDGLKMYKASGSRVVFHKGFLKAEGFSQIEK